MMQIHVHANLVLTQTSRLRCAILVGHRLYVRHDWSYVSLDILYCYPEDVGDYVCVAKNRVGGAETIPVRLSVKPKRAVDHDTQFPEGMEGVHKLQEFEEHWSNM